MRKIRRKVYEGEFGPSVQESIVLFHDIDEEFFFDEIEALRKQSKSVISTISFVKCKDALGCVLIEPDEMEKFLEFCKEEERVASSESYQDWRNHPRKTIDPCMFQNNESYRKGIIDALNMFKLEVLCTMKEVEVNYEKFSEELEK